MKLGVGGGNMVYLDLADTTREIGRAAVLNKLEGILEIYEKFVGTDPLDEPMKIFPAVHYSMGGLFASFTKDPTSGGLKFGDPRNMSTNIPGLYAMGEVSFHYHGANRLGANSLLSCIFDGLFGGSCVKTYVNDVGPASQDIQQSTFDRLVKQETDRQQQLVSNKGDENPYLLWQEMGRAMTENCTVVRDNNRLQATLEQCQQWKERYRKVQLSDTGMWTNQNLSFTRALRDMIILAEAVLEGALQRNESRGVHYKPAFPERDDANFLKATLARYDSASNRPVIEYGPIDTSLVAPRPRTYSKKADADPKPAQAAATANT
jgi:succinate dehydrogenase / fumarate reductase flavoprotein subunit